MCSNKLVHTLGRAFIKIIRAAEKNGLASCILVELHLDIFNPKGCFREAKMLLCIHVSDISPNARMTYQVDVLDNQHNLEHDGLAPAHLTL